MNFTKTKGFCQANLMILCGVAIVAKAQNLLSGSGDERKVQARSDQEPRKIGLM
jgi:hypothetical protein